MAPHTFFKAALMTLCASLMPTAFALDGGSARRELIVNGTDSDPGRYPWFVSIRGSEDLSTYQAECGASLIDDRLILTAAHCFGKPGDGSIPAASAENFAEIGLDASNFPPALAPGGKKMVVVGALNATGGQLREVQLIIVHPKYDPTTQYHDIAIMVLKTPLPDQPKVKLYEAATDTYSYLGTTRLFTAIGLGNYASTENDAAFGFLSSYFNTSDINDDPNKVLEEVIIGSLTERPACGDALTQVARVKDPSAPATIVDAGQLCAGAANAMDVMEDAMEIATAIANLTGPVAESLQDIFKHISRFNDTCQGDSGGPLFVKGDDAASDVQYGVVSYGPGCGFGFAGVYTNIQAFFQPAVYDDFLLTITKNIPGSNAAAIAAAASAGTTPSN